MITVLHNKKFLEAQLAGGLCNDQVLVTFLGNQPMSDFEIVASVKTDDLDEAFKLTNSINKPWFNNPQVKVIKKSRRSTSIGDILEHNGKMFVVVARGFVELKKRPK